MIDLFTLLFGRLKSHTYFATTLSGFKDASNRFKVFREDESPTIETPYIEIEIDDGPQDQRTNWSAPYVTFHVWGKATDITTLNAIRDKIVEIAFETTCLPAVGALGGIDYEIIGRPVFGRGKNPVTGLAVRSVALRFGFRE